MLTQPTPSFVRRSAYGPEPKRRAATLPRLHDVRRRRRERPGGRNLPLPHHLPVLDRRTPRGPDLRRPFRHRFGFINVGEAPFVSVAVRQEKAAREQPGDNRVFKVHGSQTTGILPDPLSADCYFLSAGCTGVGMFLPPGINTPKGYNPGQHPIVS